MYQQTSFLKFITINTLAFMTNAINAYARSIDTEANTESSNNVVGVLPIVCVIGVVVVAASGGFCLFSSKKQKKQKRMSEEYINKPDKSSSPSISSSSESFNSELHKLNPEVVEEADIVIHVDKLNNDEFKNDNNNDLAKGNEEGTQNKRRSILDTLLSRSSRKEHNKQNIQFIDDRSLNSISTNEDWIAEQKYNADLKNEEEMYEDDEEEVNSNDGFWNSDLEPIQSSTSRKQESYGIPSLGKRNSVIVKKNSDLNNKHQSIIILEEDDKEISKRVSVGSKDSSDPRPTRVKSWKNNDLNKEINELMKSIEEKERLAKIKE